MGVERSIRRGRVSVAVAVAVAGARGMLVAAVVAGATSAHAAPVLRQVDDFENNTTQFWTNGGRTAGPVNVSTGGPAGAGDNFLRVTSRGGSGAGSRLATLSRAARWIGNYNTPGVSAVEMDLRNFGDAPLQMRIGLQETGGTRFASTRAFNLPADGLWHHAVFNLTASELTRAGGTQLPTALTRVSELRLVHSAGADFQGDPVAASVGVDNIRAVPEPAAGMVALIAGALLVARRRR